MAGKGSPKKAPAKKDSAKSTAARSASKNSRVKIEEPKENLFKAPGDAQLRKDYLTGLLNQTNVEDRSKFLIDNKIKTEVKRRGDLYR